LHTVDWVTPGMTLLVHAIAGGVGLFLLQLAKAAGARVYGTTSTAEKAEVAKRLGADAVLVGRDMVRAAVGGGEEAVRAQMEMLASDLMKAMKMTGVASLADISAKVLWTAPGR